ncbi:hypothetical protein EB118_01965 [bacterium]|nr:hypothetical protein [bacterium]NDC94183.1 hypothetical protein [bacterium]NDD83015.1 hypothetical protein [bacterium]NDG28853.1 hypothetical protein [bacterium]
MPVCEKVQQLLKRPQPVQRTPEWYKARQTMITASEAASCLFRSERVCKPYVDLFGLTGFKYKDSDPLNPYEKKRDYIIKKCSLFYDEYVYKDTVHTLWGKKYEDAASRLYCQLTNKKLLEFGLVPHGSLSWLAASPDGITEDGVMLEIKCPKSRKIDAGCIPLYYWVQVQIQLEVCDLEQCDFIECEIREFGDFTEFCESTAEHKGVAIQLPDTDSDPKFLYPSPDVRTNTEYIHWTIVNLKALGSAAKETYYTITKYVVRSIPRSREWFNAVKDDIKGTFDVVQSLQGNREAFLEFKNETNNTTSEYMNEQVRVGRSKTGVPAGNTNKNTDLGVCMID